ncbi:DUF6152 family protein [Alishewanella tabrizica]|uniref:DUF5666 domain-containing protein n=1 Tax=Alishewanella tabrizica TaxID=671278 RepID=A0ABQ2WUL3_9ALTE|nr:DUF6152 family protein [Alishewanella tabrizica]GGW71702.1 hypothetical protein GCM10008111_29810 [Alishewanella tabrizica]
MYTKRIKTPLIAAASGLLFWAAAASAHHGWAWTESEQTEMTGTITEIFIGPPHPRLMINTTEGTWQVDLGNPRQTQEAGFVEGEASVGDTVLIRGHRSAKEEERIIKAVRATIKDKQYTFYPKLVLED